MEAIDSIMAEGKQILLTGDSNSKNMERFSLSYLKYFPASTVVNAGFAGDTLEAILYRVQQMNFPQSVSQISLLCGTKKSVTVFEILSPIANKCPTDFIHFYPILPRFDHCYSFVQVTSSHFFQVQERFSERVFFNDLPPSLCTGMTKSI